MEKHQEQYQQQPYYPQQEQYQQTNYSHPQQQGQYQQQNYAQPQHQMPQEPSPAYQNYASPQPMNAHEKMPTQEHAHNHSQKVPEQGRRKWAFGLFDCFDPLDVCCISFWCPCYMFGKTYERNKTGEQDPSGFNGMCCAWLATAYCGCAPILQCVQRQNTRDKHGIEGNCGGDFCISCCCACCTLIQEEKESIVRTTGMDPTTGQAYQAVPQMKYP